jgi:hypothetical protein
VNNIMKRIKTIEVSLTPKQIVLLWLEQVLKGKFEQAADQCPSPRTAIANSVASNVRMALQGQPEELVERAILQGRREADVLYNLAIEVNKEVVAQFDAHSREYKYLLGYFDLMLRCLLRANCTEDLCRLTRLFVNDVFRLHGAISQVRQQEFDGQIILFSHYAAKLDKQLAMADFALELHNSIAEQLKLPALTKDRIYEELQADVEYLLSLWYGIAQVNMLAAFGTGADCRASIRQCMSRLKGDSVPIPAW